MLGFRRKRTNLHEKYDHPHVDHAGGLPGLFKARAVSNRGPVDFKIFGPAGRRALDADDADFPATSRFIDLLFGKQGAFGYLKDFSAPLRFQVNDIDAPATASALPEVRTVFDEGGLLISSVAGHHRDAPAVVYRIDHAGKSITFSGDIDASGLAGLRRIAQGTSLLVFNSVVLDPPGSPDVLYTLHTPPKAIGEVADAVRAGQLLLSHLSPALDAQRDAVKASIAAHYAGGVVFAQDGQRLAPRGAPPPAIVPVPAPSSTPVPTDPTKVITRAMPSGRRNTAASNFMRWPTDGLPLTKPSVPTPRSRPRK